MPLFIFEEKGNCVVIVKTITPKYHNEHISNYINKPFFDKTNASIDEIKGNPQPAGVIKCKIRRRQSFSMEQQKK